MKSRVPRIYQNTRGKYYFKVDGKRVYIPIDGSKHIKNEELLNYVVKNKKYHRKLKKKKKLKKKLYFEKKVIPQLKKEPLPDSRNINNISLHPAFTLSTSGQDGLNKVMNKLANQVEYIPVKPKSLPIKLKVVSKMNAPLPERPSKIDIEMTDIPQADLGKEKMDYENHITQDKFKRKADSEIPIYHPPKNKKIRLDKKRTLP